MRWNISKHLKPKIVKMYYNFLSDEEDANLC